jgi:hypothetical protein
MELFKKIPWEFDEKDYEIRILYQDHLINITVFKGNYPANGFRYQIQLPKSTDVQKLLKFNHFNHMIEYAKEDIKQDRWKPFSK